MGKFRLLIIIIAVTGLAGVIFGFFSFFGGGGSGAVSELAAAGETSTGMGITYLPLTEGLSEYYGLGVDYGNLVTEVTRGSPADLAGLKAGDVILSFNGTAPEEQASLLGMMMACPAGKTVRLEVWREGKVRTLELFHDWE